MTPAQRVLLRRLNDGPDTWLDGTPLTFREELRNEEASLATGQELRIVREAMFEPGEGLEFARNFLGGWIDEHIDFLDSRSDYTHTYESPRTP